MDRQLISVNFADKNSMLEKLREILQDSQFCGQKTAYLGAITELHKELKGEITYIFEYPYVDRHYRDTFYFYHSAKFEEFRRNCIRVHLFSGDSITMPDDIITMSLDDKNKYRGFFIVRPLSRFPLGRSLISPAAFKERNIVSCLMKHRVSLVGQRFEVFGFPHIAQDTETHTCAESSLWSLFEYLGNRYIQYLPLLPSQIIHKLSSVSSHRSLPSIGLSIDEISRCLHDNGCECIIDKAIDKDSNIDESRLSLLKIYIESGIPVYVTLEDDKGGGHAVLIIGHEEGYKHISLTSTTSTTSTDKEVCKDVSEFEKKMVVIDDNLPPYQIRPLKELTRYNQNYKISHYFVPLPKHTNMDAQAAFFLSKTIFNDENVGLKRFGEKWLTRLFLTGSHSFKNFLLERGGGLDEALKRYLIFLEFSKFIWICEIYKPEEFQAERCSGVLIIDATGSNSLGSILWYNVGDKLITHNGFGWTEIKSIKPFKMATYKHNLKGKWSKWR
ncbi:MAG: hypothetical protein LBF80_06035 [Spirochaetaceae bacterium]|jgi:hypothetical protein|nr:hypothetical protein [Spirochaetaceae bacterium]